jgi:predicted branched-subunit amino acid permease
LIKRIKPHQNFSSYQDFFLMKISAAFTDGICDMLVVILSYLPFGLVCGWTSVKVGLTIPASLALPALVYAGSSQAVLVEFLQNSASLWVAVLSGCVVNLRMAVYSAAMAPYLRHLSPLRRMLAAAFLVDNVFAFIQRRQANKPTDPHIMHYYAGLTCVLWLSWLIFCALGVYFGNIVPASWQLDFAVPLSFIALGVPSIRSLPLGVAAVTGGIASVLLFALPLKLGLIAACFVGLLAGLCAQNGGAVWGKPKAG